ncbi:hypothetical protein BCR44DRAFT_1425074 [Catenaria anguillulae PL171]|uniref:Uncharacterized protein n=1 Tax=Catenaria anguillulae PL171 TaxID=765915 RepID=A0A1Y2I4P4_9FUNG|nr:hypothetical protein BCR44DRAFT_1425074 [Catenaria anguillulae PL171]
MASITSKFFQWSGSAFCLGPTLVWLVHAAVSSWALFRKSKRSYYYSAMCCIALLRLLGISINCFVVNLTDENAMANWLVVQAFVEWPASVGFSFLNAYRYSFLSSVAKGGTLLGPELILASNLLMAVNMVTFNVSMGLYTYSAIARLPLDRANFWFAFTNMYDAILNAYISGVFLLYLRAKGLQAAPQPKSSVAVPNSRSRIGLLALRRRREVQTGHECEDKNGGMRHGLKSLVQVDSILIPAECLAVIAGNALQVVSKDLDPMWSTYYAAEASLPIFHRFLITLNQIMLQSNSTANAQLDSHRASVSRSR